MAVKIEKKKSPEELKQEALKKAQNEKHLYLFQTLLDVTRPNDKKHDSRWRELRASACKLYIIILSATALSDDGLEAPCKFSLISLKQRSRIDMKHLKKSLVELLEAGLIREHSPAKEGMTPEYSLVYNLSPEVIEKGVM